ncbi:glutamate ligase domain-containing protein [Alienimonas californiensis]|uniref:UDP-N-acetylmuramate--L-alanine ligase MurC n=1 Tax=Alienimonas californiensis TaxID=2527989 RepID=A0A517PAH8_9PLAN|nr:cyanophycin synthetase [Alienimonas californiensis]QDT16375.1 UDP-N-acetylmuramate--L-alanine ligase MurC [Alienimonas californiensis]
MLDPFTPGRVFCVGTAGSGVRAMAELLHGFGWTVAGTDRGKPDVLARMRAKGLAVTHDSGGRSWDERPDLLLYSPAVPSTDGARQRAAAEGVPQATHIDLLAELTKRRETIAVAGTHGKSSTAALLVHLLRCSGRRVAGFVGAEPVDPNYSFADPDPELLVVEACEWNRHFLRLSPTHAVMTGVEFDHPDSYRDAAELEAAFEEFCREIHSRAVQFWQEDCFAFGEAPRFLLYSNDSPGARRAAKSCGETLVRGEAYGDYGEAGGYEPAPDGSAVTMRLFLPEQGEPLRFPVPQHSHPDNVGFAIAAADYFLRRTDGLWRHHLVSTRDFLRGDVSAATNGDLVDRFTAALRSAPALRRRFETLGDWHGRTVIDDYAHHPTALRETRAKAQRAGTSGRAAVLFQPHQLARTEGLFMKFAGALSGYAAAAVLPVFPARETASGEQCAALSRRLAEAAGATFLPDLDALPRWADDSTRPGDALVLAGAGDIDRARDLLFPGVPGARPSPGT